MYVGTICNSFNIRNTNVFLIFTISNFKPKDQIIKKATAWKFLRSTLTPLCIYYLFIESKPNI